MTLTLIQKKTTEAKTTEASGGEDTAGDTQLPPPLQPPQPPPPPPEEGAIGGQQPNPFQPGAASTPASGPYHGSEAHEMTHFGPEQSGLADTTLLLPQDQRERAWNKTTSLFPDASATDLEAYYHPISKRLMIKMAGAGKKPYPLYTEERFTKRQRLNPRLLKEITFALGKPAEEKLVEQRQEIRETDQRLKEAKQLEKTLNETAAKQQQVAQEKQAKEAQLEQLNQRIANIENEGGTVIERQNEIDRLKRQKAKIERDIEEAKEKSKEYAKTIIKREKATREVERLQRKLADKEQKRNATEARLNRTKPLDELKEEQETLERQIKENKRVIEDENTSPSEREAAQARNEEGEEELARLNQQIQEREKARPLRERIKEVFKKYGFTVTAVITAVGLTIGVIVDKLTTGVGSVTKAIVNGLKDLG